MRLIDKDKFLKEVKQRHYTPSSIKLIESQKEVDAIPIKYIKNKIKKYTGKISQQKISILLTLIDDWRKENESN